MQQAMVSAPMQPIRRYGLGAVNWYTGQTLVITRKHKRRQEVAELLEALHQRHKDGRIYVAWDNAVRTRMKKSRRSADGRLILLSLPTYGPWLDPIEMVWRHFRREVAHCELFGSIEALLESALRTSRRSYAVVIP
jgi:transposase